MSPLLSRPTKRANDATRAIPTLHPKAPGDYLALVPHTHGICLLCVRDGIFHTVETKGRARQKHFDEHKEKDLEGAEAIVDQHRTNPDAFDGDVRKVLNDKASKVPIEPLVDPPKGLIVAIVHQSDPYSILELCRQGPNGPVSEIHAATTTGLIAIPDMPNLARLNGSPLVAAPSCIPALVPALECNAPAFWTWFQRINDLQKQRAKDETRVFTGTWMSIKRVIENHHAAVPSKEAVECLKLFKFLNDETDPVLRLTGLMNASNKTLRYINDTFIQAPKSFEFETEVAREAEKAMFGVMAKVALTDHDVLCFLVNPTTARFASKLLGEADPVDVLFALHEQFTPRLELADDPWNGGVRGEFMAWFTFRAPEPLDWNVLAATFPRVTYLARATLLLTGPSSYYQHQLAQAAKDREEPAKFEATLCGKKRAAPTVQVNAAPLEVHVAPPMEPKSKRIKVAESEQPLPDDDDGSSSDDSSGDGVSEG